MLDHARRDSLVANLAEAEERQKLKAENRVLKEAQDRRLVVDTVRRHLERVNVKAELMAGAVALFMSQHKFAVIDGEVRVVGKEGAGDAETAAVNFVTGEGAAFADKRRPSSIDDGFAAEIAKLRRLN